MDRLSRAHTLYGGQMFVTLLKDPFKKRQIWRVKKKRCEFTLRVISLGGIWRSSKPGTIGRTDLQRTGGRTIRDGGGLLFPPVHAHTGWVAGCFFAHVYCGTFGGGLDPLRNGLE